MCVCVCARARVCVCVCVWDSLSELRNSLSERRLERRVLRPALLPVKSAQFT